MFLEKYFLVYGVFVFTRFVFESFIFFHNNTLWKIAAHVLSFAHACRHTCCMSEDFFKRQEHVFLLENRKRTKRE